MDQIKIHNAIQKAWAGEMLDARSGVRGKPWQERGKLVDIDAIAEHAYLLLTKARPVRRDSNTATLLRHSAGRFISVLRQYADEQRKTATPDNRFHSPDDLTDAVHAATAAAEVFMRPTLGTATLGQSLRIMVSAKLAAANAADVPCPPIPASAEKALHAAAQKVLGMRSGEW
jgi:hypothetical protein